MNRFEQQMKFILEIDKVKNVFRQNLSGGMETRKENDAEHSWHMAIMAFLLKEYAQEEVDIMRVVLMVLTHDLVEIDAGDTYAYDLDGLQTKREREVKAAERIFGLLPKDQEEQFRELWDEFEAYESAEAKYAHMLDNFQPLMLNDALDGKSWKEHKVKKSQIYSRNAKTMEGSEKIWEYMKDLVQKNIDRGNIQDE